MIGFAVNSRYYGATVIGVYSVFKAYTAIISIGSSGYLEQSFFIEKRSYRFKYIYISILFFAISVSIFSSIILRLFNIEFIFFIILTILSETLIRVTTSLNISQNRIFFISFCNLVFSPINQTLFYLAYLVWGKNDLNLIIVSSISSFFFSIIITYLTFIKLNLRISLKDLYNFNFIFLTFRRYIKFIKFSMTGEFLRTLAFQAPTIVLGRYFGKEVAGFYGVSNRIVLLPIQVLVGTISQIYISKLSLLKKNNLELMSFTFTLIKILSLLAFVGLIIFYLFGQYLLILLLGEEFSSIYDIVKSLIPYAIGLVILTPLFSIFTVFEKQESLYYMKLLIFISSLFSFGMCIFLNDYILGIYLFSFSILFIYLFFGRKSLIIIKSHVKKDN